jgi:hypothetical protein
MEATGEMRHYIQYHNPERYGPPQPQGEDEVFSVLTRKRAERVI